MCVNEARFYAEIRPELSIEAPRTFGSLFDERTRQFGILMEDLTLRPARFPNVTTTVSLQEVTGLLEPLAEYRRAAGDPVKRADRLRRAINDALEARAKQIAAGAQSKS